MDTPVSRVKYRVRRRNPLGIRRQSGTARVNASSLQFSLGGFLLTHFNKLEIRFRWDHRKLRERLVGPENMRAAFGRRFEDQEEHHRPPLPQERRHSDRNGVCRIGIKTWMGFDFDRQPLFDLQVEKYLIGVKLFAESPERRP
jgi:hypothetical protein